MIIPIDVPTRNAYLNANGTSTGQVFLNSTWGFIKGAFVLISADGLAPFEGEIVTVAHTYLIIKPRPATFSGSDWTFTAVSTAKAPNYGVADLSAYTTTLNAKVWQNQQYVYGTEPHVVESFHKVSLELLNAPTSYLGTVTSTGVAKNNATTANSFYAPGALSNSTQAALKEMVVTVTPDVACYVKVGTDNTVAASANDEPLQAGEKRTFTLGGTEGWISVLAISGGTVNLKVMRHVLV